MDKLSNWDRNSKDDVLIGPLLGWEVARTPLIGIMRILYAYSDEERKSGGKAVQLSLNAQQALELSRSLNELAAKLTAQDAATATKQ